MVSDQSTLAVLPIRPALMILAGFALGPLGLGLLSPVAIDSLAPVIAASLAAVGAMVELEVRALSPQNRVFTLGLLAAVGFAIVAFGERTLAGSAWTTMLGIFLAAAVATAAWLLVSTSSGEGDEWVFFVGAVLMLGGLAAFLASSALIAGLVAGVLWSAAGPPALPRIRTGLRYIQHPMLVGILVVAGTHLNPAAALLVAIGLLAPRMPHVLSPGLVGVALVVDALQVSRVIDRSDPFAMTIAAFVVIDAIAALAVRRTSLA